MVVIFASIFSITAVVVNYNALESALSKCFIIIAPESHGSPWDANLSLASVTLRHQQF